MGRKSTFSQEVADKICQKLSEGIPLAEICREPGMPSVRAVSDWKAAHEEFGAAFARARDEGFDAIAADCLRIADDVSCDVIQTDNGPRANTEFVARSRLRVDTRLKLLAKWDPKRYGERTTLAGDPDAPLSGTDDQLLARAAAILASAKGEGSGG